MNNEFLLSVKLSKKDRDYISRVIRYNFPPGTIFIRKHDKKVGSTMITVPKYSVKDYISQQHCVIHNLYSSYNNLSLQVFITGIGYIELYVGKCLINNNHLGNIALITTILKNVPLSIVIRKIKRQRI